MKSIPSVVLAVACLVFSFQSLLGSETPETMPKVKVVKKSSRPTKESNPKNSRAHQVQKIELTGSRIKVPNFSQKSLLHGDSQRQVLDQNQIRRSGASDLRTLLSRVPQSR